MEEIKFYDISIPTPNEFICNKSKSQCNHCGRCSKKSRKWIGMNKGRIKKRRN